MDPPESVEFHFIARLPLPPPPSTPSPPLSLSLSPLSLSLLVGLARINYFKTEFSSYQNLVIHIYISLHPLQEYGYMTCSGRTLSGHTAGRETLGLTDDTDHV